MPPISGLQAFQTQLISGGPGVEVSEQRFTVSSGRPGESEVLQLAKPTTPASGWDRFVGALVRLVGPPPASEGERAALLQFRSALSERYGQSVSQAAGRSLTDSFLTAQAARQTLAEATRLARAANAGAFERAMRGAGPAKADTKSAPGDKAAASFRYEALPPALQELLMNVSLGQDLTRSTADEDHIAIAAGKATQILDRLAASPGMSLGRAHQVLHMAALSPNWAVASQLALDLLAAPGAARLVLADKPCLDNTGVAQFLAKGFTARAETSREHWEAAPQQEAGPASGQAAGTGTVTASLLAAHAEIAQRALKMQSDSDAQVMVPRQAAQPAFAMAAQCQTDCERSDITVNGKRLLRDQTAFSDEFRRAFGDGEGGDALALMVSCLANQAPIGPLAGYASRNLHYRQDKASQVPKFCIDVWQRADARWAVRLSVHQAFNERLDPGSDTGFSAMPEPSAALLTLEFTIDPGQGGAKPTLASIASDAVYHSGLGLHGPPASGPQAS